MIASPSLAVEQDIFPNGKDDQIRSMGHLFRFLDQDLVVFDRGIIHFIDISPV